ncbi:MAG TPA: acyl-CoA dehydrogenase family protein [Rhizomicrobium sp.]|nr:acyl-CoA dehydrogenase family protein [Rhizomicrobium sp.]
MEFAWSEAQKAFRAHLRQFLADNLPPDWLTTYARKGPGSHAMMAFAREFCPKMAEAGLLTRHWPKEYGGEESSPWEHIILSEELWSAGEPRSSAYMGTNFIGPAIMGFGTAEQKEFFLKRIARGEMLWCQGFSEPSAGSDLASLRTQAERTEGGYVINGSKIWTSYAHSADFCFLLARTEGGSHAGITIFLLDMKSPGILIRPINSLAGEGDLHEVFFDNVFAPENARLGDEGKGWTIVRKALHGERVGAARYEFAARATQRAVEYLKEQGRFDDPIVQATAAETLAIAEATRLLVYKVIDQRVQGLPPTADTSIARYAIMQADKAAANFILEFVPEAAIEETDPYLFLMFEKSLGVGIAAGASEIQLNLIARDYLQLPQGA